MRRRVLSEMAWLGPEIDEVAHARGEAQIGAGKPLLVIPTVEEGIAAGTARTLVNGA